MIADTGRFFAFLPTVFLTSPSLADIVPFEPPAAESVQPESSVFLTSWPAVVGTGLFLCVAVILAVLVARRSRRIRATFSNIQKRSSGYGRRNADCNSVSYGRLTGDI